MSKQLHISLAFTAKTNEAIAQIKQLQRELNNISLGRPGGKSPIENITPEIQTAMRAASQLQAALEGAVNVRTGKLDLGKFSDILNKNQIKLRDYAQQLSVLGPTGNKAFLQLAQAISQAEMPLIRTGKLLKDLGTTLANTARWQLSSNILHGFMSSVSSAYRYAQDLNESLNNIRIVTGQNIDQMAKFASEANKAARALGTTTTKYADASLIYYQQGLSDAQVKERTDITIKMANVARQNAEIVSDQMTAVWNNFYDGSKSLEYYADVMTALGAATASSTDEISDGLNKFAAVADTVGLSYEYAAAALATLTSNTRENADIVGNALKTLFARIQGLQLGETLEDGTTMNKYSEALDKVGISVYETSGELKAMDKILTEMAAKWNTLSSTQQIALAQTVAGVRQYNQLVALMENWDNGDSDSMMANLNTSYNSTGALNKQAEIYAESWEAASKRVKSSLERIYTTLLNDEFFIDLTNAASAVLDTIGNITDAFGGVKGILLIISSLITKIFHKEIVDKMHNLAYSVKRLTPSGRQAEQRKKEEAWAAAAELKSFTTGNERVAEAKVLEQEVSLQRKLLENAENLTEHELKQYQIRMDTVRALQEQAKAQSKIADEEKKKHQEQLDGIRRTAKQAAQDGKKEEKEEAKRKILEEADSKKSEIDAEHLRAQEEYRQKREAEIRERAEKNYRKNAPRVRHIGTGFEAEVVAVGENAVARAAERLDLELEELAEKQVKAYENSLAQQIAEAEQKIEDTANRMGSTVDSYTKTISGLGKTVGITNRIASSASQQAVRDLGQEDTRAVAKNTIKDIQVLKRQIDEISQEREIFGEQDTATLQAIDELTGKLEKLLEDPKADAKELQELLAQIADQVDVVRTATRETYKEASQDAAGNTPLTADQYQPIFDQAVALEEAQGKFDSIMHASGEAVRDLGDDIDAAGHKIPTLADKLTYGTEALMGFGMTLTSIDGIIDTVFDPDMSGFEKMIAIVTTLSTMVPMLMSAFDAYTKIVQKNTVAQGVNAAAAGAVTTGVVGQTTAVRANALAWLGHPIIGIIAGATMVAVAAFSIYNNAVAQNSERIAENAKEARENAKAVKEQVDANADLITQYKKALSVYEESGESEQDLIDTTWQLAEAYDLQGRAIAVLTGNYSNLTKQLTEARKAELELLQVENERAIKASSTEVIDKMDSNIGKVKNGEYYGTYKYGSSARDEDIFVRSALQDGDYGYLSEDADTGNITFRVDVDDPKAILGLIEELQTLQNEARSKAIDAGGQIGGSEVYESISEQLKDLEELYPEFADLLNQQEQVQIELAAYDAGLFDAKTIAEFESALNSLSDSFDEENLEKFISQYGELLKLSQESKGFEEKFSSDNKDLDEIKAFYDSLDQTSQDVFWTINFDQDANLDNVKNALSEMQDYIDSTNLSTSIEVKAKTKELLEKALKSGSKADWEAFKTEYDKVEYDKSYDEFIQMSNEDKYNYLDTDYSNTTAGIVVEDEYKQAKETADKEAKKVSEAKKRVEELNKQIEIENEKIAIAEKNIEARKTGNSEVTYTKSTGEQILRDSMYAGFGYEGITDSEEYETYRSGLFGHILDSGEGGKKEYLGVQYEDPTADFAAADWTTGFDNLQYRMEMAGQVSGQLYDWISSMAHGEGYSEDIVAKLMELAQNQNIQIDENVLRGMLEGSGSTDVQDFANLDKLFQLLGESYGVDFGLQDFYGSDKQAIQTSKDLIENTYIPEIAQQETYVDETSVDNIANAYQTVAQLEYQAQEGLKKTAEQYDLNADELKTYVDLLENEYGSTLKDQYETTAEYQKALQSIAIANKRLEKGVKTLAKDWKDWNKVMTSSDSSMEDISTILPDINEAIADILNLSTEDFSLLPPDFAKKHWSLIQDVMNNVEGSVDKLRNIAGQEILMTIDGVVDPNGKIKEDFAGIHEAIASFDASQFTVGVKLDEEAEKEFYANCQNIIDAAGMTAEQAQAYFGSMGYNVEFKKEPKTVTETVWDYTYDNDYDENNNLTSRTVMGTPKVLEGTVEVPVIKTITPNGSYGGGIGVNTTAPAGATKSKKGGGGGSQKKPAKKPKKTDIVERYKEINDSLDDVADAMEDASKAADRLYGKSRLDFMKKNNSLLKQEIELTKKKREEAIKYLNEDRNNLFKAASEAGLNLTIDENGLITNYTQEMTKLYNQLDAEVTKANKDGNADEKEQARIDKIQERIDALKEAISQYDETRELIEDLDNDLDEKFYQWQDNNYEMLTYELEIKINLNDDELKVIDYYLSKISDDFYQMAEAAALMVGQDGNDQLSVYRDNLSNYGDQVKSLEDAYAKGEISQSAFVEGMREAQDGILSNLRSLNELDSAMMRYYGETLAAAGEEIAKYVDQMDHLTTVLDHYQSLMEIMGKSTDYESIGVILEGKVKVLSDQAAVAKETMEMYKDQAEQRYADYEQALLNGDEAAAKLYLQQYQDALAAANEAEQEYLSKAEEWAEALTEVLKNKLSSLGRDLEKALTGGMSFDRLNTGMERAKAIQEEYLTTTNKIYETNKLMRKAQQEIDKTSNSIAKKRLQEFITETDQLQDKAKLSNFELEIQQAKYDLLLAEIALQEAQNAKSTVRLQRDSEGNFGYVYTADEAIIADAESTLLDKQNALYNISLEGANNYKEKYLQTLNEMYDTLADLQQQKLEGAFASEEEYQQAVQEATLYYYGMLEQYSYLHGVAIATDGRVLNEAWSHEFNDMVQDTASWKDDVDLYLSQAADAFTQWKDDINIIAEEVGLPLATIGSSVNNVVNQFTDLRDRVKDVTTESELLREQIIGEGGIIEATKDEVNAVVDITKKYASLRDELNKVKSAYEEIIVAIGKTIEKQSQLASASAPSIPSNNTSFTGGTSNGSASSGNTSGGSSNQGTSNTGSSGGGGGGYNNEGKSKEEVKRAQKWVGVSQDGKWGPKSQKAGKNSPAKSSSVTVVLEYMDSHSGGGGSRGGSISGGWQPRQEAMLFDTGGYTGKWGSYGKWAMLHEKELVLNAKDTENFLAGMGILDKIISIIDLQSANSQLGGLLSAPSYREIRDNQILEQSVHIEASFPNVTNHSEIEEAFNNLINTASQYANRK